MEAEIAMPLRNKLKDCHEGYNVDNRHKKFYYEDLYNVSQ